MKTYTRSIAGFVTALGLILLWMPKPASAQLLIRLDSEFHGTAEGGEISTTTPALSGGTQIFSKTVFVPFGFSTGYLTISTQGDSHGGVALQLECLVDGSACSPDFGGPAADAPAGWITPSKHFNYTSTYTLPDGTVTSGGDGGGGNGDMHDNSINHTWCVNLKPGVHTFSINLGNSCGGSLTPSCTGASTVFLENVHFYIDASSSFSGQCSAAPKSGSDTAAAATAPSASN
jgi:hypothetical protein